MNLTDICMTRCLCRITSSKSNRAGIDLELRYNERNGGVFNSGVSKFCQGVIDALVEDLL